MQVYGWVCIPVLLFKTANTQTQHKTIDIYRLHVMFNLQVNIFMPLMHISLKLLPACIYIYTYIYIYGSYEAPYPLPFPSLLLVIIEHLMWNIHWRVEIRALNSQRKFLGSEQTCAQVVQLFTIPLKSTLATPSFNIMFSQTAIALQFAGPKAYPLSYLRGQVKSFNFIPNMNLASTFPHANNTMI